MFWFRSTQNPTFRDCSHFVLAQYWQKLLMLISTNDLEFFTHQVRDATLKCWTEVIHEIPDPYAFALFTTESPVGIIPSIGTISGLKTQIANIDMSRIWPNEMDAILRWDYCSWDFLNMGLDFFPITNDFFDPFKVDRLPAVLAAMISAMADLRKKVPPDIFLIVSVHDSIFTSRIEHASANFLNPQRLYTKFALENAPDDERETDSKNFFKSYVDYCGLLNLNFG